MFVLFMAYSQQRKRKFWMMTGFSISIWYDLKEVKEV